MTIYTENIITTYLVADERERAIGDDWYRAAHVFAQGLTKARKGLTISQACGIVAALSPQLSWRANQVAAVQLVRTGTAGAVLGSNLAKARAILTGADVRETLGFNDPEKVKRGQGAKVRSFYLNILDPVRSTAVTVDRHAVAVAFGHLPEGREQVNLLGRRGGYESVADAYREAADLLGTTPLRVQAVTWTVWRNRFADEHGKRTRGEDQL